MSEQVYSEISTISLENKSYEIYLDEINSSNDINFDGIDDDLAAFQEDEMVKQALNRGVDLKKYGRELEKDLKERESELIVQHVENNPLVVQLHAQMLECDAVLARMQEMLQGFQGDLGGISEEIKHLQDESHNMNIKLKNRKKTEEKLNNFLINSSLAPELADSIMSASMNEDFVQAVLNLGKKLKYLQQSEPPLDGSSLDIAPCNTFSGRTLLPEFEKLKIRSISKIREYFMIQFNALRKPKTNVQVLQQTSLLKYSALMSFIQNEMPAIADELRSTYIESMARTLQSLFKCYYNQLMKLELVMAGKSDLIVVEEVALKSMFMNKMNLSNKKYDVFSIGEREKILEQIELEPILLHVAQAESQKYPFEAIIRSIIKHLSDAATNEFLFIVDFFKTSPKDTFNRIFGRTISLVLENLENYLLNCYDLIGLLLLIRITHSQRLIMQRRRIPTLDPFFDRISMLLWPKFKQLFDSNVKSLKNANAKRLGSIDLGPHFVSKRYADLVSSILVLQASGSPLGIGGGGEVMVQKDLHLMRVEMIALLERLSLLISSNKDKIVFLIHNYDYILTTFQDKKIQGEEVQKFDDLFMQQREKYAEEEVRGSFSKLISFVIQTEQVLSGTNRGGTISLDEGLVEGLVKDFSSTWRSGIQQINDDVITYFANIRSGTEILKQVLTQLLLYYTRFQDIIKKSWSKPMPFTRDLISTATILMEIKKYSRTF